MCSKAWCIALVCSANVRASPCSAGAGLLWQHRSFRACHCCSNRTLVRILTLVVMYRHVYSPHSIAWLQDATDAGEASSRPRFLDNDADCQAVLGALVRTNSSLGRPAPLAVDRFPRSNKSTPSPLSSDGTPSGAIVVCLMLWPWHAGATA